MCARFTLRATPETIAGLFEIDEVPEMPARYNIAPTQPVIAITAGREGGRRMKWLRWGLVPSWAKDPSMGQKLINARAENLADRPSFRNAFARRRCLIPADGFYEWMDSLEFGMGSLEHAQAPSPKPTAQGTFALDLELDGIGSKFQTPNSKLSSRRVSNKKPRRQPYYLGLQDFSVFAFAGLWEFWKSPEGEPLETCTIITTEPNELVRPMHDRMPVILRPDDYDLWLDRSIENPETLSQLLRPFPAEAMTAYPVDPVVNNANNETPECVAPVVTEPG